jgi:hypothetical protein
VAVGYQLIVTYLEVHHPLAHTHVLCLAQNCSGIEKFTGLFKVAKYMVIFTASQVTYYCLRCNWIVAVDT